MNPRLFFYVKVKAHKYKDKITFKSEEFELMEKTHLLNQVEKVLRIIYDKYMNILT